MKARIIGCVVVLLVLAGLYILVGENNQSIHVQQNSQPLQEEANPLKGLRIN